MAGSMSVCAYKYEHECACVCVWARMLHSHRKALVIQSTKSAFLSAINFCQFKQYNNASNNKKTLFSQPKLKFILHSNTSTHTHIHTYVYTCMYRNAFTHIWFTLQWEYVILNMCVLNLWSLQPLVLVFSSKFISLQTMARRKIWGCNLKFYSIY